MENVEIEQIRADLKQLNAEVSRLSAHVNVLHKLLGVKMGYKQVGVITETGEFVQISGQPERILAD